MDRRKKRTSTNQYMMYIDMMEKDSIFATGRIPRDVDMNYLHERWKELSDKLNTCSSGPKLTAGEWRKRLNDWKNTTRCKYRRSITSEDITLTTLELKALQLFGKAPNISNSTEELSIHLKSEKYEDDDEMEHQPTSEKFQKELQAAVEEAIGGDEDEEVMDEPEQGSDMVSDPLPISQQNMVVNTVNGGGGGAGMAISSNGASQNNNSHNGNNNATTTYRTIVVENKYTDGDDSDEADMIGQRRQHSTTSSNTSNVALKTSGGGSVQSNTSTNTPVAASVAKLMNGGDISIKRTRTQPGEHIIYEVSTVKKAPNLLQQSTHQQPQRIVKTIHNNDVQQQHVESCSQPAINSNNITAGNLVASTADCRDIARQLKRLADIKAEKLKFEVARFKFNNPGFVFNLNHI